MPIGISDAADYRFVGPVWVILCSVITVMYSDVLWVLIVLFPLSISIGRFRHKASVIKIKIYV